MNYWHMNLHPTDERGSDNDIIKVVLSRTIGMGIWKNKKTGTIDSQVLHFKDRVKVGDIVAILNGTIPIALVEVIGDWYEFDCDTNSIVWFELRRAVKVLSIRDAENGYVASLPNIPMNRTKTLTISKTKATKTYKYIDAWHQHYKASA